MHVLILILSCHSLFKFTRDLRSVSVLSIENREGWPLLTVETEVNWDSKSTKGSSLGWFVGLVVPVQEIFVLRWLL